VIPAVPQAGRLGSADVIISTINVNGVRAAIKNWKGNVKKSGCNCLLISER
jgi:hypothetical protein